jgi:hypothetical protein
MKTQRDVEYAAFNKARDKRKVRRAKRLQQMLKGGIQQVPIINAGNR